MELSLKERQKLTRLTARNYQAARQRGKSAVLDTFISRTGCGRKYAIHLLDTEGKINQPRRRARTCGSAGYGCFGKV